jgi:hypothetical protein
MAINLDCVTSRGCHKRAQAAYVPKVMFAARAAWHMRDASRAGKGLGQEAS